MAELSELLQEIGSGKMEQEQTPAPTPEPVKPTVEAQTTIIPKNQEPQGSGTLPPNPIEQTPATGEQPQNTTPPADDDIPDEKVYGRLSKLTDNAIKSEEDFVGMVNHYNELLEQAEKGFEPKFPNERAKWAYQILTQNEGNEPEAAMRTLRALNFDPKGKSPKEILFEAFLQDPTNSDLGPVEAQQYFDAEYEQKFDDADGNLLKKRQLDLEVRKATESLQKIKDEFGSTQEQPRQISEEVEKSISSSVEEFGGVRIAFTDNPQESEYLNMPIDDPNELSALKQDALNPQDWWQNFLQGFETDKGFDYKNFIREFHEMRNHQKKAQLAYDHGFKLGQLAKINEARNASNPKDISKVGAPGAGSGQPKSVLDAWANAQRG